MRSKLFLAAALAAAVPAGAASAQSPATPAVPAAQALDPAAERAARELLGLMNFDRLMNQGMAAPLAAMRTGAVLDQALSANPKFAAAKAKNPDAWHAAMQRLGAKQADATEQMLTAMGPDVQNFAVRLYATKFTAPELQQIIAFYRTPVGQKAIAVMPQIMSETVLWLQQQMPQHMQAMMQSLGPAIQQELKPLLPAGEQ